EGLCGGIEGVIAEAGAILDLQLEAAHRAQSCHRRRREHRDEGVLDARVLAIERHGDGRTAQLRRPALAERLQGCENDAGAGAVGKAGDRKTRKSDRALDARLTHGAVARPADDAFGPVKRGTGGEQWKADEILLVLAGDEARRDDPEETERRDDQRQTDGKAERLAG